MSFLPLDHVSHDDRFDPSLEIEFDGDTKSYTAALEGAHSGPNVRLPSHTVVWRSSTASSAAARWRRERWFVERTEESLSVYGSCSTDFRQRTSSRRGWRVGPASLA